MLEIRYSVTVYGWFCSARSAQRVQPAQHNYSTTIRLLLHGAPFISLKKSEQHRWHSDGRRNWSRQDTATHPRLQLTHFISFVPSTPINVLCIVHFSYTCKSIYTLPFLNHLYSIIATTTISIRCRRIRRAMTFKRVVCCVVEPSYGVLFIIRCTFKFNYNIGMADPRSTQYETLVSALR